jgi:hypothetical protein
LKIFTMFGQGGGHRIVIACVQQALQDHPAIRHVVVPGQVDPAHPAVGEAADDLVLAGYQLAGLQLGFEREGGSALAAEAGGAPGSAVAPAPNRLAAAAAEAPILGHHSGVAQHRIGGVAIGHRRDLDQAGAKAAAHRRSRPARGGAAARAD